jgi:hypothetical protein
MIGDKLLRPAMVVVAAPPPEAAAPTIGLEGDTAPEPTKPRGEGED